MRALTSLRNAAATIQGNAGKAPEMPLTAIVKDPLNPRLPFESRTATEQQKQRELNANVKKRGIKSPISLRAHPTISDKWIINHGHCRYDAAREAGLETIPYFVDPNFDSYDQVAENLHRTDLSVWAIAEFIKRKLEQGESKGQIAEGLGKETQAYVTDHLALIDAPQCLHAAYDMGVQSARTLYDLRRVYEEFPDQVEQWCSGGPKITRESIKELQERLRHDVIGIEATVASEESHDMCELQDVGDITRASGLCGHEGTVDGIEPPSTESGGLDHAVPESPLRHDVKNFMSKSDNVSVRPTTQSPSSVAVPVFYKGKPARVVSNSIVTIEVEGQKQALKVRLAELVFAGPA